MLSCAFVNWKTSVKLNKLCIFKFFLIAGKISGVSIAGLVFFFLHLNIYDSKKGHWVPNFLCTYLAHWCPAVDGSSLAQLIPPSTLHNLQQPLRVTERLLQVPALCRYQLVWDQTLMVQVKALKHSRTFGNFMHVLLLLSGKLEEQISQEKVS